MTQSSRRDWKSGDPVRLQHINAGSLQRIAAAVEAMSANYIGLQADLTYYKRLAEERSLRIQHLHRCNAALRGVITKLKKGGK
jgi:hypothetical protein